MKDRIVGLSAALMLFFAACAPAPPALAPTSVPAAKPTVAAVSAADWDQIVAAARREGAVSVIGPQGSASRDALSVGFNRMYPDLQVQYGGLAGAQTGPKVLNELAATLLQLLA